MKSHLVLCLFGLVPLLGCSTPSDEPASEHSTAGAPASADSGGGGELPNLLRTFPTTGPEGAEVVVFTQSTNIGDFEIFQLRDGILHVRIPYTLSNPYVWVRSNDSDCRNDDVMGECVCAFAPPVATGSIELTLPADIPMPG